MNLLVLTHVPFEGPAAIADWAKERGHTLTLWPLYEKETAPTKQADGLIVMGGPMNIYDELQFPWLTPEKAYIKKAIDNEVPVLGICLGAQLIADVLGSRITQNPDTEMGWWNVTWSASSKAALLPDLLEDESLVFHWHADTFALPSGAERLASNLACFNQGFRFGNKVLAMQFHMESTPESVTALIENSGDTLMDSTYVQSAEEMQQQDPAVYEAMQKQLFGILDKLFS